MEANFTDFLPCYNKLSGDNSASFVFCLILSPLLRIIIQAKNLDHYHCCDEQIYFSVSLKLCENLDWSIIKDKEAILRKSKFLRGTNILVTEDFPKRVREHRAELIRFAKEVFKTQTNRQKQSFENHHFRFAKLTRTLASSFSGTNCSLIMKFTFSATTRAVWSTRLSH